MEDKAAIPESRSQKARDKTASAIAFNIGHKTEIVKETLEDDGKVRVIEKQVERAFIEVLAVQNRGDAARGREDKFNPNGAGKPPGVGLPTGGSESLEFIDHVATREAKDESGYYVDCILKNFTEFRVDKKIKGSDIIHPHYVYWIKVDPCYVIEIKEKSEIEKAAWLPVSDILRRVRLGQEAWEERRVNREAFYFSHANDFLMPILMYIYNLTPEQIEAEPNPACKAALKQYQPLVWREIEENWDECMDLGVFRRCIELGLIVKNEESEEIQEENKVA